MVPRVALNPFLTIFFLGWLGKVGAKAGGKGVAKGFAKGIGGAFAKVSFRGFTKVGIGVGIGTFGFAGIYGALNGQNVATEALRGFFNVLTGGAADSISDSTLNIMLIVIIAVVIVAVLLFMRSRNNSMPVHMGSNQSREVKKRIKQQIKRGEY